MDIETLTTFFMWCTIISGGMFVFSVILCMSLKDIIARMHGKMFGLSPEAVKTAVYGYIGLFKIFFIVFNLVPYVALLIMTCPSK